MWCILTLMLNSYNEMDITHVTKQKKYLNPNNNLVTFFNRNQALESLCVSHTIEQDYTKTTSDQS